MSQYGALAKAQGGAGASSILSSYYGGAKPSRLPADRMPTSIRVALDTGRSGVTVTGPGRFRVLDEAGRALAVVATGEWKVLPAAQGKLRIVPPPGQEAVPGIEALGVGPVPPSQDSPRLLHIRLSAPALVQVILQTATGETAASTPPQLAEAGESVVTLPPPPKPGPYSVSLTAFSGLYRVAMTPVDPTALPPAGTTEESSGRLAASRQSPPVVPAAIAFMLLLGVTAVLLVDRLAFPQPEIARPHER